MPNRHHIFRIHPASYWTFRCITSWRPSNRSLDRVHPSYGHYSNDHYYNYERDNDFYVAWDAVSRERDRFQAWMQRHVLDTADIAEYHRSLDQALASA